MIKYLGSKRLLVPMILSEIQALPKTPRVRTVVDLFSGTSRVGHACKRAGFRVLANDHNQYAETIARCYVQADAGLLPLAQKHLVHLQDTKPEPGWFTEAYAVQSRFFTPENAGKIEAIRERIERLSLTSPELKAILLTSLMEAADRVDSTVGVQMAYLKAYAKRASNPLELRLPDVLPEVSAGPCRAHGLDALEAARRLSGDVCYLDPPYNQHKYLGNYHIWETLVRWDRPDTYGVAMKRTDCRTSQSLFNGKRSCEDALAAVIDAVDARYLVVSFSNEGFVSKEHLEAILSRRGKVKTLTFDHPRYVGAKIGIYNPSGDKVGTPGPLRNKEHLFIVGH